MHKLLLTACAGLVACACLADQNPDPRTITMAMGAKTGLTNTINNLRGYLDEIQVSCSDGISTGTVALAYVPLDGITPAVNVATGAVAAAKVWRPSLDRTDIAGVDLTSDPPWRVMFAGESLRMIVLGSPTNKAWTATIKLDKPK
ncbi:MAG: hypothetical protein WC374_06380 [Phycisphaerae bacterium]